MIALSPGGSRTPPPASADQPSSLGISCDENRQSGLLRLRLIPQLSFDAGTVNRRHSSNQSDFSVRLPYSRLDRAIHHESRNWEAPSRLDTAFLFGHQNVGTPRCAPILTRQET